MTTPGLFDVMYTCRSMRRLKPDPVPLDLIHQVIEAGTMAPSGSNRQPWAFIAVTDPTLKSHLQPLFAAACSRYTAAARNRYEDLKAPVPPQVERNLRATEYLSDHLAEAPVLLFVYVREYKPQEGPSFGPAGSIFPAIQNILLACRALGLGATLTGFMSAYREELAALLGAPPDHCPVAMIPIGYPLGRFGPTRRKPVESVAHLNVWGAALTINR